MFANSAAGWYHRNQFNGQAPCEHCGRIVRHEHWCVTRDGLVQYAFGAVQDPSALMFRDRLILHALGVAWDETHCSRECEQSVVG